jgi:hypothetical protein
MDELEAISRIICRQINGIEPIDADDGSSNWWMFRDEAKRVLRERPELGVSIVQAWKDHREVVKRVQAVIDDVKELVPPLKKAK